MRTTEKGDEVTLKKFAVDEKGNSKNLAEIEFKVSDGKQALKLFEELGFKVSVTIDKYRKYYDYENFEIAVDDVKGLGMFAEFEIKNFPEDADIKDGFIKIKAFMKSIGFEEYKECVRGYVSFFWNPDYSFINIKKL